MTERLHRRGHRLGYPRELFRPIEVPAMAEPRLATETEAADYNAYHFMAQEFVRQRGLWPDWESILPMNERRSPTAILAWRERGTR